MSRACFKTLAIACVAIAPLFAHAQLTANVSLTSNYKFRGQDQDANRVKAFKPALQGGFDYTFGDSGWYVGNWNSSVDWLANNSLEMDFYGGYKMKAGDVDLDFGALQYVYSGASKANTTELYASATYSGFTAKYSHTVSKDYFGNAGARDSSLRGRNTGYLNLSYSQEVLPKLTVKASVGFTSYSSDIKNKGIKNYTDYSVGAVYDLGDGLSLGAAYVGANKQAAYGAINRDRFIVTLSKTL